MTKNTASGQVHIDTNVLAPKEEFLMKIQYSEGGGEEGQESFKFFGLVFGATTIVRMRFV
jgi:hypothetical protein